MKSAPGSKRNPYWTLLSIFGEWRIYLAHRPDYPFHSFFFDYGIHLLSGTLVVDKEEAFRCISQEATFREVRGGAQGHDDEGMMGR